MGALTLTGWYQFTDWDPEWDKKKRTKEANNNIVSNCFLTVVAM